MAEISYYVLAEVKSDSIDTVKEVPFLRRSLRNCAFSDLLPAWGMCVVMATILGVVSVVAALATFSWLVRPVWQKLRDDIGMIINVSRVEKYYCTPKLKDWEEKSRWQCRSPRDTLSSEPVLDRMQSICHFNFIFCALSFHLPSD